MSKFIMTIDCLMGTRELISEMSSQNLITVFLLIKNQPFILWENHGVNFLKFHYWMKTEDHIYKRKVKTVPYKKLAEFNYKLIHVTITPGYIINKWNKSIPILWLSIGEILQIDIKWKDIVLGLNDNKTKKYSQKLYFYCCGLCHLLFMG